MPDPDYRFLLANERTFLALVRTALALEAGGLAVGTVVPARTWWLPRVVGAALLLMGTAVAVAAFGRWRSVDRAIRAERPLPPFRLPRWLAAGIALAGLAGLLLVFLAP